MKQIKEKEKKIDICCFRYKCKVCPKQRECEERNNMQKEKNKGDK